MTDREFTERMFALLDELLAIPTRQIVRVDEESLGFADEEVPS